MVSLIIGLIIGASVIYIWVGAKETDTTNQSPEVTNTPPNPDQGLLDTIAKQDEEILALQLVAAGLDENKDWMAGGRGIAYIANISTTSVSVDPILWLSHTDGSCTSNDEFIIGTPICNPNEFLEINMSTTTTTLPLTQSAVFSTLAQDNSGNVIGQDINIKEYLEPPYGEGDEGPGAFINTLVWVEITKGKVERLVMQYRP